MPTILILVLAAQLSTGTSPAEILSAGQPLAAQDSYKNKGTRPAYIVLALEPGEEFSNGTDREFRVLDQRSLQMLLDLELSDLAVQQRQDAIQDYRAELSELGGELDTLSGERHRGEDR